MTPREQAMEKIRKLLAIGTDGRGNTNEAETAMRQAHALMRKFQIETADEVMRELKDEKHMTSSFESPYAYPAVDIPKTVPAWVGVISWGVGKLCEVRASVTIHKTKGAGILFMGYDIDVQFASWLYRYLLTSVHGGSVKHGGSRAEREAYRRSAASVVQHRLVELWTSQRQAAEDSKTAANKTALMIINTKSEELAKAFGPAPEDVFVKRKQSQHMGAAMMGALDASQMHIPTNRPLEDKGKPSAPAVAAQRHLPAPKKARPQEEIF